MTNQQRIKIMTEKLTARLAPTQLEIIDDSHKHIGHAGAQSGAGHFTVKIAAPVFDGKPMLACHRLIYAALGDLIPQEIHALQIKIL